MASLNTRIKEALTITHIDIQQCTQALDELHGLPITHIVLRIFPQLIATLQKVYIKNAIFSQLE